MYTLVKAYHHITFSNSCFEYYFSLLLHAKVQEYPQCHALTSIWLRHPDNISHPEYKELVTTYIQFVLQPQNKCDNIQQFLDSCPGLTYGDKEELQRKLKPATPENETCDGHLSKGSLNPYESANKDRKHKDETESLTGNGYLLHYLNTVKPHLNAPG